VGLACKILCLVVFCMFWWECCLVLVYAEFGFLRLVVGFGDFVVFAVVFCGFRWVRAFGETLVFGYLVVALAFRMLW